MLCVCVFVCSLLQLQEEKEREFHEHRSALDQLTRSKDHEVQGLQARMQQMSVELQTSKEVGTGLARKGRGSGT